MARQPNNPLDHIPTPGAVREKLEETQLLAKRLRALLAISRRVHGEEKQVRAKCEVASVAAR